MGRTKKVGITGRFGTRYGVTLRKRVRAIEVKQKAWHTCASCDSKRVKRVSTGLWECRFCGRRFTGGAYIPETEVGRTAKRTAKRLAKN